MRSLSSIRGRAVWPPARRTPAARIDRGRVCYGREQSRHGLGTHTHLPLSHTRPSQYIPCALPGRTYFHDAQMVSGRRRSHGRR